MQASTAARAAVLPCLAARPVARRGSSSARRSPTLVRAGGKDDVVDDNVAEYCTLDASGKRPKRELTLGEKEQLFLESMMSYYYDDKPVLSNEEFDNLKNELQWEGSKVVILTKEEQLLLEARMAYLAGRPIMGNDEYDALKASLAGASVFTLREEGPSCTLGKPGEKGRKQGEAETDYAKMLLLTLPPALIVGGGLIGADMALGAPLMKIGGTTGVIIWCGIIMPSVYCIAASISQAIFTNGKILKAACPNCGEENLTYFGDILTVAGPRDKSLVKCPCCQSELTFDAQEQKVTVTQLAPSS